MDHRYISTQTSSPVDGATRYKLTHSPEVVGVPLSTSSPDVKVWRCQVWDHSKGKVVKTRLKDASGQPYRCGDLSRDMMRKRAIKFSEGQLKATQEGIDLSHQQPWEKNLNMSMDDLWEVFVQLKLNARKGKGWTKSREEKNRVTVGNQYFYHFRPAFPHITTLQGLVYYDPLRQTKLQDDWEEVLNRKLESGELGTGSVDGLGSFLANFLRALKKARYLPPWYEIAAYERRGSSKQKDDRWVINDEAELAALVNHISTTPVTQKDLELANHRKLKMAGLYIQILAYTGLRKGEMEELEWQDVCFETSDRFADGYISFERFMDKVKHSKGEPTRKFTKIPLWPLAKEALLALRSMGDVTTELISTDQSAKVCSWPINMLQKRIKVMTTEFYEAHGIQGRYFTLHKLRAFTVYYLEEVKGLSTAAVDGFMGNTSRTRRSNYDYTLHGWSETLLPEVKASKRQKWNGGESLKADFKTA